MEAGEVFKAKVSSSLKHGLLQYSTSRLFWQQISIHIQAYQSSAPLSRRTSLTSCLAASCISGCLAKLYRVQDIAEAVVSWPGTETRCMEQTSVTYDAFSSSRACVAVRRPDATHDSRPLPCVRKPSQWTKRQNNKTFEHVRPNPHRTRDATRAQIGTFFL